MERTASRPCWLLVILAVVAIAGCGTASTTAKTVSGGTVTIRLNDDWASLDVQSVISANSYYVSQALYDRLIAIGPGEKALPYLAESWKDSPTSITFTIRKDVTCADRTPLTASVVANSLKRYVTVNPSRARQLLGPGPYGISADDTARTVTVSLGTPYGDAIYGFAGAETAVICPSGLADPKQLVDKSFGSGPYVIESFTHGDSMVLTARHDWKWGPYGVTAQTPGFPQKLVYKVVPNETTAANLLLTGGVDVAQILGADVKRLRSDKSLNYNIVRPFYRYPLIMNEAPGHPTADEAVRQAMMTAVEPSAWNQTANGGFGQTGTSVFPSDWDCYDPTTAKLVPQQPSPQKAQSILMAAGYTLGSAGKLQKDGKLLSVIVVAANTQGSGPDYLSSQFEKAGIATVLRVTEYNTNAIAVRSGNYDVTVLTPGGVSPSPAQSIGLLSGPLPPKGTNYAFIIDPVLDQGVAAAVAAAGSERCQRWRDVQQRFLQRHELLPMAAPDITAFARQIDLQQGSGFIEPSSLRRRAS